MWQVGVPEWMARWVRRAPVQAEESWPVAPLSAAVPQRAPQEEPISVPEYEDFVLARRRLPSEPRRALEAARRAAVADPEVRRRVLGSEAGALALQEAVQLAVLQRLAEGRPVRRQG